MIFGWYRKDFESGPRGTESVEEFLAMYAHLLADSETARQAVSSGAVPVRFLEYDWILNEAKP